MFFRVTIWIEPPHTTGSLPYPRVIVDHMDNILFRPTTAYDSNTWFIFGGYMEEELTRQLNRALAAAARHHAVQPTRGVWG